MKRISSIQGIRALCFFQIFMLHSCYMFSNLYTKWLLAVPWSMELFFMISGFGIVLGYQHRIDSIPNKVSEWCKFVWKRLKKVFPLHVTMLLVSALYFAIQIVFNDYIIEIKNAIISFLVQLTLCISWIPTEKYNPLFNSLVWFLSSLFFSYFLAIPALHFLKKVKNYRTITILLMIIKLAAAALPVDPYWIHKWPVMRFTDFFLGMLAAEFYLKCKNIKKPERKQLIATLGLIVMILICCLYYTGMEYIHPNALLAIACFFFIRYIPYGGIVGHFLENRLLVWLGNLSMEFYLIHLSVIRFLWSFWSMIGRQVDIILIILEFVISVILAALWNRFVSKRMYRK